MKRTFIEASRITVDKRRKNSSWDPFDPVINISKGRIDLAISDDFVMENSGRVKHRIAKDVFVNIDSGSLEIIEPIFEKKKRKN